MIKTLSPREVLEDLVKHFTYDSIAVRDEETHEGHPFVLDEEIGSMTLSDTGIFRVVGEEVVLSEPALVGVLVLTSKLISHEACIACARVPNVYNGYDFWTCVITKYKTALITLMARVIDGTFIILGKQVRIVRITGFDGMYYLGNESLPISLGDSSFVYPAYSFIWQLTGGSEVNQVTFLETDCDKLITDYSKIVIGTRTDYDRFIRNVLEMNDKKIRFLDQTEHYQLLNQTRDMLTGSEYQPLHPTLLQNLFRIHSFIESLNSSKWNHGAFRDIEFHYSTRTTSRRRMYDYVIFEKEEFVKPISVIVPGHSKSWGVNGFNDQFNLWICFIDPIKTLFPAVSCSNVYGGKDWYITYHRNRGNFAYIRFCRTGHFIDSNGSLVPEPLFDSSIHSVLEEPVTVYEASHMFLSKVLFRSGNMDVEIKPIAESESRKQGIKNLKNLPPDSIHLLPWSPDIPGYIGKELEVDNYVVVDGLFNYMIESLQLYTSSVPEVEYIEVEDRNEISRFETFVDLLISKQKMYKKEPTLSLKNEMDGITANLYKISDDQLKKAQDRYSNGLISLERLEELKAIFTLE